MTARDLAETIVAIIEGGFILSRGFNDPVVVARLSRQFNQYRELLFRWTGRKSTGRSKPKHSAREKPR